MTNNTGERAKSTDFVKDVALSFELNQMPSGIEFDRFNLPEAAFTVFEDGRVKISDKLTPEESAKSAWGVFLGMVRSHNDLMDELISLRKKVEAADKMAYHVSAMREWMRINEYDYSALRESLTAYRNV